MSLTFVETLLIVIGTYYVGIAAAGIEEMENEQVVPDVIDVLPQSVLDVKYGDVAVDLGNVLTPTQVRNPPEICWEADPDKLYLVSMTDPDAPSRQNPRFREWLHYLVGNIPGSDISQGQLLATFAGSTPPRGTGLHRYVILVYEQPEMLTFEETGLSNNRKSFSIRNFAAKYNLDAQPIAGNFFQAEYEG